MASHQSVASFVDVVCGMCTINCDFVNKYYIFNNKIYTAKTAFASFLKVQSAVRIQNMYEQADKRAVSQLLEWFSTGPDIQNLPKDARTLLKTPRECLLENMGNGQFYFCGIKHGLLKAFEKYGNSVSKYILHFNIDGLPIHKSTKKTFWPILCRISNLPEELPFCVAIYYGNVDNDYEEAVKKLVYIERIPPKINIINKINETVEPNKALRRSPRKHHSPDKPLGSLTSLKPLEYIRPSKEGTKLLENRTLFSTASTPSTTSARAAGGTLGATQTLLETNEGTTTLLDHGTPVDGALTPVTSARAPGTTLGAIQTRLETNEGLLRDILRRTQRMEQKINNLMTVKAQEEQDNSVDK